MGTLVRVNVSGSQKGTRINFSKEEGIPGGSPRGVPCKY